MDSSAAALWRMAEGGAVRPRMRSVETDLMEDVSNELSLGVVERLQLVIAGPRLQQLAEGTLHQRHLLRPTREGATATALRHPTLTLAQILRFRLLQRRLVSHPPAASICILRAAHP